MTAPTPSPSCEPRYATPRTDRPSKIADLEVVATAMGMRLLPWQRLVGEVALEMTDEGLPAYREVVVSVPRQAGKTWLLFAWLLTAALEAPDRGLVYTAQTALEGRAKLLDEVWPRAGRRLERYVRRTYKAMGDTSIYLRNGSRIKVGSSVVDAGHGKTIDGAVIDEAWADIDDRREVALRPAMITRPHAQLWVASAAGTEQSVYWARKVAAGRHAAASGVTEGLAYFEWSAPEDAPSDDEDVWWQAHPALGHTVSLRVLRAEHLRMRDAEDEFRRAYLNIPTSAKWERIIPQPVWDAVCGLQVAVERPERFAADAMPDRSAAAIAVYGDGALELVESREGVTWVGERLRELWERHRLPVVIDSRGPLGSVIEPLRAAGVRVRPATTDEFIAACARFLDAVTDGEVRVRRSPALDGAVAAARKRPVGDRWLWSRQASQTDVSPLVAATLALGVEERECTPVRLIRL